MGAEGVDGDGALVSWGLGDGREDGKGQRRAGVGDFCVSLTALLALCF